MQAAQAQYAHRARCTGAARRGEYTTDMERELAGEPEPPARLGPEVFRLPVERLRDGYYSDAYFVFAKRLLEDDGQHAQVLMRSLARADRRRLVGAHRGRDRRLDRRAGVVVGR